MEQPIKSLSLHLRDRVVTKGGNIKNLIKSQPLFDVLRQYLTFLIDLQAEVLRFRCRIFSLFCLFSQNLARFSLGFIFYKLLSDGCLAFRFV